ncbi:beta-ketoacyl synthase N-terminal-like domain-containing protein [Maribacter algicola]|uniref:Beta-ketoacyl synthase N-terminal-like domain-containing protein n=1 Tax=Meishania litoralis TaxID=3434685 RepID=A0ACC7LP50_9FLAO
MTKPISITAIASISPLGTTLDEAWSGYQTPEPFFGQKIFNGRLEWVAPLSKNTREAVIKLRKSDTRYKNLDDSVLFAVLASRNALDMVEWGGSDYFGINIGSSRGATSLFEKYHEEFIQKKKSSTLSSPTTTLGNISSWVAHDLRSKGPEISHSITCSTSLHSLLNGVAWIRSGMADKFIVGGSEAPLTPFTIAQMKALKIYSHENHGFPCKSLDLEKKRNSMVLGEGASVACLEMGVSDNTLAIIEGMGYATEVLHNNTSISTEADCFQQSMKMALGKIKPEKVDVIVTHTPGTVNGDMAEFRAIDKVFGKKMPALTTNKWKIGHTFGASGMLSVEFAILMMKFQKFIGIPFLKYGRHPDEIKKVMVNAVGFGGNAVSVLLKVPS